MDSKIESESFVVTPREFLALEHRRNFIFHFDSTSQGCTKELGKQVIVEGKLYFQLLYDIYSISIQRSNLTSQENNNHAMHTHHGRPRRVRRSRSTNHADQLSTAQKFEVRISSSSPGV